MSQLGHGEAASGRLVEALRRISSATLRSTNSATAEDMRSWCKAVADSALADFDKQAAAKAATQQDWFCGHCGDFKKPFILTCGCGEDWPGLGWDDEIDDYGARKDGLEFRPEPSPSPLQAREKGK